QQNQRLLRDIRTIPLGGTFFTRGRVKSDQARVEEGTLPPGVHAAPVLTLTPVSHVGAGRKIEILPITFGLVWFDAWTADFESEQPGNFESVISNEFCLETPAALARQFAVVRIAAL